MEPIVGRQWRLLAPYGFAARYWLAQLRELYGDFQASAAPGAARLRWAEKDPTNTLLLPFIERALPGRPVRPSAPRRPRRGGLLPRSLGLPLGGPGGALGVATLRAGRARARAPRWPPTATTSCATRPWWRTRRRAARACSRSSASRGTRPCWSSIAAEHDATERYQRFTARAREAGGDDSAIYRSRVGAGRSGLDPVLRGLLRTGSGQLLRDLGYLER